jgi:Secretion system C-terminal sorting domain
MKIIPVILLTGIVCHLSFSQSLQDFFPLKIGNHWQYAYQSLEKRYESLYPIQTTTDSGIVQYEIIDSASQDSMIVWNIQETDSVTRKIQNYSYFNMPDTSFSIIAHVMFQLYEYQDSLHTIKSQSYFEVFTFPVRYGYGYVSTIPIFRFHQDTSSIVLKEYIWTGVLFTDSLCFQKKIGLLYGQANTSKGPGTPYYYGWQASLTSMITSVDYKDNELPSSYLTLQNYPNPFNPITLIAFQLPHKSHITINIFDALGRNVQCLLDSHLGAGYHEIRWDASNHASGIYFCRLQTDESTKTIKIVLLK